MKIVFMALLLPFVSASVSFGNSNEFLALLRKYGVLNMYDIQTLPQPKRVLYDFIVVGAGPAGSAVATRLSEMKRANVLLLEAGQPEVALIQVPMLSGAFLGTDYNWGYKVEPQKNACWGRNNNQCSYPRGKSLGGTTSINGMIATRGNKLDYDMWAEMGNDGWSYDDVLPYFKKMEKYNVKGVRNMSYHGTNGNVNIESLRYRTPLATEFIKGAVELGYKHQEDYNGAEQEGFSYIQATMKRGERCSAGRAYLSNQKRPNLDIVPGALVTKILIDEQRKKAYGVQYVINGVYRKVYAIREVIVSAGTMNSPKLLMLSGVGPKDHLQELNIPVMKDAKVGYNLVDHVGMMGPTFLVNQSVTLLASRLAQPSVLRAYGAHRSGPLSLPGGFESLSFIRTKYARDARPDLEILFVSRSVAFNNGPGSPTPQDFSDELYNTVYRPIEGKDAFMVLPLMLDSRSRGRVTLRSKDPFAAPVMQPNALSDPLDVEVVLEGVKIAIEIAKTKGFQAFGTRLHDIKFPQCKKYEFNTDDYWRCAIKTMTTLTYHAVGTVKMGPKDDPDAVVDPQLRVYGIKGLRVADASIMPRLPCAHTSLPSYMIGEKLADMIKQLEEESHWPEIFDRRLG